MVTNAQMEQIQVEEASHQFVSLISDSLQLLKGQQGALILDMGYTLEERLSLWGQVAENLLRTGIQGLSPEALYEALGTVLLTKIIHSLYEEHMTCQEACSLLQKSLEFRAYVKRHPPVTSSTRRDRPTRTNSTGQTEPVSDLEDEVPEVPERNRIYYHRGVGARPGRTVGRTRWRLDRAVRE
jgi:hypothetical protein